MAVQTFLAVDIGASSGRVAAVALENGQKISFSEIFRFKNGFNLKDGFDCWDIEALAASVEQGLARAKGLGACSVGIDTWGCDFVLLDNEGRLLTPCISYRDKRTRQTSKELLAKLGAAKLYKKTGIQFLEFNTLYQLAALQRHKPQALQAAATFLMAPDYLNYHLTGCKTNEYTNATTTQLINASTQTWDEELVQEAGLASVLTAKPLQPGALIGSLRAPLAKKLGIEPLDVYAVGSHDTASAIAACPLQPSERAVYISSGTWSLIGVERSQPLVTEEALNNNYTNEGGVCGTVRFLKNIVGLWLVQEAKRLYGEGISFADLERAAAQEKGFDSIIDPNRSCFFNPDHMLEAIAEFCRNTGQTVPRNPGQYVRCIYNSLACSYRRCAEELGELTGQSIQKIYIVGGGSRDCALNQAAADISRLPVSAGLPEATAIGNALLQAIGQKAIKDLDEAREITRRSFVLKTFQPQAPWQQTEPLYARYLSILEAGR